MNEQTMDRYRLHLMLCAGTACVSTQSFGIREALNKQLLKHGLDKEVLVIMTGCNGFCALGPIMTVMPEGIFYHSLTEDVIPHLVEEHFLKGRPVKKLMFTLPDEQVAVPLISDIGFFAHQTLVALRNRGLIDPEQIDEYIARDGYKALAKALTKMSPEDIINEMKLSGLRGRGGGGFPTGKKWEICHSSILEKREENSEAPCYVICNADEGDPGAYMDRSILEADPHSVLEGMLIGARAIGAEEGYIYIRAEYPLARERLQIAIKQAREYGLIGENIFNTDFSFDIQIDQGAGAFVCGEETSLIASIEGRAPEPTERPPYPAQSGLWGGSTNINNVETWATVPSIIKRGAEWFAGMGTEKSKGTKVFSLVGKVVNTGLIEVLMGTTLKKIIFDIGGGIPEGKKFKGVQTGGPSGGVIPVSLLQLRVDYERLKEAGAIMGSGGMIVIDEDTCMVDLARYFLEFTSDESCGKCSSCREGAAALYEILERICSGEGEMSDLDLLEEISHAVKDASMCGLGQTLPNPVLSSLQHFKDEYIEHIKYKRCPAGICKKIISSSCQHACPLDQDVPCYIGLIAQKKYEEAIKVVRQKNPLPAVCGRVCTHPCESKCKAGAGGAKAINIKALKRFLADYEMQKGIAVDMSPKAANGRKVAVIGAGPAGLSCGYYLALEGYEVVIFESLPVAGGMLAVGIPTYRLPREILDYEIEIIKKAGVEIRTNTTVGKDIRFEEIQADYDAVFIAAGAHAGLKLGIPGEDTPGVVDAVEFLRKVSLGADVEIGSKVVVIGGGNAAIDAARTAKRLGKDVKICYRRTRGQMPAIPEEVEEAIHEGVEIEYLVAPVKAVAADGKLAAVEFQRMELGDFDKSGRPRPVPIEGSQFTTEVDTLIPAISQEPDISSLVGDGKLAITKWNTIDADAETFYTGVEGVFAGGDVVAGPDTVTTALADGKIAASMIDKYIRGEELKREYSVTRPIQRVEAVELTEEEVETMTEAEIPVIDVEKRKSNFDEVELAFEEAAAVKEAKRCYRCDLETAKND